MKVTNVEKKEKSIVALTVQVDAEAFEAAVQAAYLKNRGKLSVPGFRRGKAPRKILEGMYGTGVFYDDAINALYPDAYDAAVKEQGLDDVGYPQVEVLEASKENGFTFQALVSVRPEATVSQRTFLPSERVSSSLPSPIFWPSSMPPALARPKQRMVPKLRTTVAREFAATASVPKCPIITEYMEKAKPQTTSLPMAGRASFTKSPKSSLFLIKMALKRSLICSDRAETTKHSASSTSRDMEVARATPMTPSFGAPSQPKMNTALSTTFSPTAMELSTVPMATRPTLLSMAI